jgi:hypothetical protein
MSYIALHQRKRKLSHETETVSLLGKPGIHEPLYLASQAGPHGDRQEILVAKESGKRLTAPVSQLPKGIKNVKTRHAAKGNMCCLSFQKP